MYRVESIIILKNNSKEYTNALNKLVITWFVSELEEQLSITEKIKEGMKWDLEQTKTTLTYQLGKKEQIIKQLRDKTMQGEV